MSTAKRKQINEYRMLSPLVAINSVHFQVRCFKTAGEKIVCAIWSQNYIKKKIIHWKFFNYTKTLPSQFYFLMFQNSIIFTYSYIMGVKSNQFYVKTIFRRLVLKIYIYAYIHIHIQTHMCLYVWKFYSNIFI